MAKLPLGLMPNTADTPETSLERLRKMQEQMGLIRPTKTVEDAPEVPPVTEAVEKAELPKLPAMAEPAEMPAEAKPAGLDLLNRLKAAQEARRKQMQNIALLEGTSGISDAITRYYGAKPPSKTDYYKRLRAEADLPMQELMEEKKATDIKSKEEGEKAAAELYRDIIKEHRPELKIPENVPVDYLKALVNVKGESGMTPYQSFLMQKHQDLLKQREIEEGRREKQFKTGLRQRQIDTARGLLKDDPRYKKAVDQSMEFEAVNSLMDQVEAGNEMAMAALGTKLARAMGEVGVLTDTDVVRYVSGTSWGRKLLDWYKKGATGVPSDASLKEMVANVKTLRGKLKGDVSKVYSGAEKRMKAAYPDLETEDIRGILGTLAMEESLKDGYSPAQERGIEKVMEANGISREAAIKALKEAGKLK